MQVTLINHMGTDLSVVNAARVSFAKESDWVWLEDEDGIPYDTDISEKDKKLIHYLAKNKHKSPFNHAFLSFRVKAPIFVARQLVKHEYLPWNEVSRRYVKDGLECSEIKWRVAADNVKQGSGGLIEIEDSVEADRIYFETVNNCFNSYHSLIDIGVCPEQARCVLPLSLMTEWIWSGSLYAFMKMCKLRLDAHAQQETREVAEEIYKHISELFPVSAKALMEYAE